MQLMKMNQEKTMTSRQIAEVTGSEHHNMMASIRRLIKLGVIAGNETPYQHQQNGRIYTEFVLNFRDTMVVASGYNAELRGKIIDRWQELESGTEASFKVPTTLAGALRLAAEQAEMIEAQALAIEAAKPAVEFVERYVESDSGSIGFRQVCKLLDANENHFRKFLAEEKIMYRLGGVLAPYAQHIDAGRFEVKTGTANEHAYAQAKFTAKGVNWVAGEYAKYKLKGQS